MPQLFVRGLEGRSVALDVEHDTSIGELKRLIAQREGVEVEDQRLRHAGWCLDNDEEMVMDQCEAGDTIQLSAVLLGGMPKKGAKKGGKEKKAKEPVRPLPSPQPFPFLRSPLPPPKHTPRPTPTFLTAPPSALPTLPTRHASTPAPSTCPTTRPASLPLPRRTASPRLTSCQPASQHSNPTLSLRPGLPPLTLFLRRPSSCCA